MQAQLQQRLQALQTHYQEGQKQLQQTQQKQTELHETLLRIGGAIQVLQEELAEAEAEENADDTDVVEMHVVEETSAEA